eukprot:3329613-Alexandrium_andersonii.AAC.1
MSASLVGSEMCIRDSTSTPSPPLSNGAAGFRKNLREAPARARSPLPMAPCLLYTSDAADDM